MTGYRHDPLAPLVLRWTIGDVSREGFEALAWSLLGMARLFGADARYVVCVNTVDPARVRTLVGPVPVDVEWRGVSPADVPAFIRERLDARFAEGVGWKFAPLRIDEDAFELALDNDCIIWTLPPAIEQWTHDGARTLIAEDVRAYFGQFSACCGDAPRNSGIRGLPPRWPFEDDVRTLLDRAREPLTSETDEQGLQVAAVCLRGTPLLVTTEEVSICSPFYPHQPHLGRCGAHFVGLNGKSVGFSYYGRPGLEVLHEHWARMRGDLAARIGGALRGH
jgi:hypothetical protein